MYTNSFKNVIDALLRPDVIVLNKEDNKRKLKVPLYKKLSIELKNDSGKNFQWLPTKKSIQQFSEIKIDQSPKKGTSIINLVPSKPGKGEIELYCLDKFNPQRVIDRFQISYYITEN